jgi:protein-L-isoaspartate(D-aspartate) O-methyltransferase
MMKKLLLLALIGMASDTMAQDAQCVPERAAMVETIQAYARIEASVLGPRGISERVLDAMGQTDRHRFVPGRSCSVAYMDGPVLIGQGQTISQPFIVALMTDLAAAKFDDTVLEVGTGSGYQAAVLARLVRKVCTVEIIPPLAEAAANVLRELGYDNVSVKIGDGYEGWPECGPFDAVIVTAALGHVPPPLIEQLKVGGRLVMPLGPADAPQQLTVIALCCFSLRRHSINSLLAGLLRFQPQAESLAHDAGQEAAHRMRLPAGRLHDGRNGCALRTLEERKRS